MADVSNATAAAVIPLQLTLSICFENVYTHAKISLC